MGYYKTWETLIAPDVPDKVRARFRPASARYWRLRTASTVVLSMAALAAPYQAGAAVFALHGAWRAVDLAVLGTEVVIVAALAGRVRSRRRIKRRWSDRIITASAQATGDPDTGARLAALDRLIERFRDGYQVLAKVGLEPAGITARTADDLHYALAAPIIASFGLRDLLAGPDAHRPELSADLVSAYAELGSLDAEFGRRYDALVELCDQIDAIRAQVEIAAARQRLRAALATADHPATVVTDAPDLESMSAAASSMAEFLRASLT